MITFKFCFWLLVYFFFVEIHKGFGKFFKNLIWNLNDKTLARLSSLSCFGSDWSNSQY